MGRESQLSPGSDFHAPELVSMRHPQKLKEVENSWVSGVEPGGFGENASAVTPS